MTSARLLRLLVLIAGGLAIVAVLQWREPEGAGIEAWLRLALIATVTAAVIIGLCGRETRPRAMLRFLASLSALIAAIALVADLTRANDAPPVTLLEALSSTMPSLVSAVQAAISSSLSPTLWSPVITSILDQPTWLIFAILAAIFGYAGRPLRHVEIFVN